MSRTAGIWTRNLFRFVAGKIQKTAKTIAGSRMNAVPLVRVANPMAALASSAVVHVGVDFQRRRKKQLATIQNATATSGLALVAARIAWGRVPQRIAAKA